MLDRFEATLDGYLAASFLKALSQALKAEGFEETLRIPDPPVIEFQKGQHLLTIQTEEQGPHRKSVVVESDSTDVRHLVGAAAKGTVVALSEELLGTLGWVDRDAVHGHVEACVDDLLG